LLDGELRAEPLVVWCNFTAEVSAVYDVLAGAGRKAAAVTGAVKPRDRGVHISRFRAGALDALVLQQQVAQVGVDLGSADTAVYYSLPAGLAAYRQTQDRIVRPGKRGVLLAYLVTEGTVDEDAHEAMVVKSLTSGQGLNRAMREQFAERRG
jgi:superfamily II DNA or RNA helicase